MNVKNLFTHALLSLILLSVCRADLQAVPARPGVITVTQSDGTRLRIRIYGDEFYHYTVSEEGYTLTAGADGDYCFATLDADGQLVSTGVKARPMAQLNATERRKLGNGLTKGLRPAAPSLQQQRMRHAQMRRHPSTRSTGSGITAPQRFIDNGFETTGHQKGLVLLAEFPDHPFTVGELADFDALLNSRNYTENYATGSAWQYYYDNSNGRFDPEFVVVGPYTLAHNRSYYTADDDLMAYKMAVETCQQAYEQGIDLSEYASNGVMRDVFVFYSGGNEADGSDSNGVWPHRYDVSYMENVTLGGVQLAGYACGSELATDDDYNIVFTGIGTFCHEFGHVLGWPDLYDTDYDTNGYALGPCLYSQMASGTYNNSSRTPPALSILERWMMGWAEPEVLTTSGEYHLGPVHKDNGYLIPTEDENDYFLLEYRGTGDNEWDNPSYYAPYENKAESGLLVYHIDYNTPNLWTWYNTVNADASHECVKLICSQPNQQDAAYYSAYSFYPGSGRVTMLTAANRSDFRSWQGTYTTCYLSDISVEDGYVSMQVSDTPYGMYDYSIEPFQHDALVTWKDDNATSWTVSWRLIGGSTDLGSLTVSEPQAHLGNLWAGLRYQVTIQNSDNISHTTTFSTQSLGKNYPHIEVSPESPEADSYLLLHLTDCNNFQSVTWYIDGNRQSAYTTLSSGEHCIKAEITLSNGNKEYIIRYITIP
ncbi:MAG: M6 family metalloprotease domain-containing protein [Bacteroides sp.]|nr:M6 family metalloprotease domain-containing protein [Bacteroides sp.]